MHFLKSFFSHFLAILIFFIILFLVSTTIVRNLLVHSVLESVISETNYMDEVINESETKYEGMEEIWEYVEIEDLINDFLADEILYKLKIIDEEPKLDVDELNDRIATGIEAYIDDQIDSYTGGFNSYLENIGIDLGIDDKINDYINNSTGIDLTNKKIITEDDLEEIYTELDKAFADIEESTYLYELLDIIYNDTLRIVLIILGIVFTIIICVINWNAVVGISYLIAPLSINAIIFLIGFIISISVDVSGTSTSNVINYIINIIGAESLKQFVILLVLTIFIIFLYYIGKLLSIRISHKTGKTTLDTFFDDYNRDEVIKELQENEKIEEKE